MKRNRCSSIWRGQVVLAAAPGGSAVGGGWANAFKDAGLPLPDGPPVYFSEQEMRFAWRSHFVAACVSPLTEETRQEAESKGWTLFELPGTAAAGVLDAMISIFGDTSR